MFWGKKKEVKTEEDWKYLGINDDWYAYISIEGVEVPGSRTTIVVHMYMKSDGAKKIVLDPPMFNSSKVETIRGWAKNKGHLWTMGLYGDDIKDAPVSTPSVYLKLEMGKRNLYWFRKAWRTLEAIEELKKQPEPEQEESIEDDTASSDGPSVEI